MRFFLALFLMVMFSGLCEAADKPFKHANRFVEWNATYKIELNHYYRFKDGTTSWYDQWLFWSWVPGIEQPVILHEHMVDETRRHGITAEEKTRGNGEFKIRFIKEMGLPLDYEGPTPEWIPPWKESSFYYLSTTPVGYQLKFMHEGQDYRVTAPSFEETWTDYDVDIANHAVFPKESRIEEMNKWQRDNFFELIKNGGK